MRKDKAKWISDEVYGEDAPFITGSIRRVKDGKLSVGVGAEGSVIISTPGKQVRIKYGDFLTATRVATAIMEAGPSAG